MQYSRCGPIFLARCIENICQRSKIQLLRSSIVQLNEHT